MELRQFKYFVRIVELGSLSRAAKDLYIAQSALSTQIANLEDELGVKLLTRSVRGVTATPAGQSLYLHAQTVLRQIGRLRHEVSAQSNAPGGPVSIGLPTSAANVIAGPLLAAVRQHYPEVRLQIIESLSGHLEEMVVNGRVEMSLLFGNEIVGPAPASQHKNFTAQMQRVPLLDEELFLLQASGRDNPCRASLSLQESAEKRFVLPGRANATRQLIDQEFAAAGLRLDLLAEIDSLSTIQSIVVSGLGATISSLSALVGLGVLDRLQISSLTGGRGAFTRRLSLCTSDVVALGPAAESVIRLVPKVARELVEQGQWMGASLTDSPEISVEERILTEQSPRAGGI